ncbi:hypothetical protein J4401_02645 [Candidatus Woesearchaeota archaeon]|nr:hypothetical protein [Candidatus Woesearchaeota archaeon]
MKVSILLAHAVFGIRRFQNREIKKIAARTRGKKILEIGSGKKVDGKHYYSMKGVFDSSNEFVQSDINKEYGHQVIDITSTKLRPEWDIILCLNVLEHVFEYDKAIANLRGGLRKNGTLYVFVPGYYPLHDEPNDFWRFTEHSLRKIFSGFETKIKAHGWRKYPFAYFLEARLP